MSRSSIWAAIVLGIGFVSVGCLGPASPTDEATGASADEISGEPELDTLGKGAHEGGKAQVQVCHVPPGNPAAAHTISVGPAAVPAHLAHGDHLGECGDDGDDGDDDGGQEPVQEPVGETVCAADGAACSANADCCGGLCGGSGLCVSTCTAGPELGGVACSESADCCSGACIWGSCYEGTTCHLAGTACDLANENDFCCFGLSCVDGTCQ